MVGFDSKTRRLEDLKTRGFNMAKKEATLALRPLDDRVVVEPTDAEEKTAGGILLPDTAKQKPQQGKVVAVGPGKLSDKGVRTAVGVKVGDLVIYGKYSGSDVEVSSKELKILRESDILAKLVK
jgi:chaperonin GroES